MNILNLELFGWTI